VRSNGLSLGDGRWHADSVWVSVEDHDAVTGKLSSSIDKETSIATGSISVWKSLADDCSSEWSVDCGPSVARNVPSGVDSGTTIPGGSIVAASVSIASSFAVRRKGTANRVVGTVGSSSAFLGSRHIIAVDVGRLSIKGDAIPDSLGSLVVGALAS